MVASSVSTMISMYASAHGWALEGLSVDVVDDPEPTPRQAEVIVHLPTGLREDQVRPGRGA